MKINKNEVPVLNGFIQLLKSKRFDEKTIHQAKRVVADTYGVAFGGVTLPAFKNAIKLKDTLFGKGDFEIWGTKEKSNLSGAVFYNALAVSSTDYDEGHRKAVGHPASVVVPVALVLGKHLNKSYTEVLKSVIFGYEAGTRFSYARKPEFIDSYSTGRWGALAAAATAAYLLELNDDVFMHALSLAFITSPAMQGGSTDVSTGSMAKEGVDWAVSSGLQSALLAQNNFTAPYLFIDAYDEIDKKKLLEKPDEDWMINTNYFKPFACCRWLHTAISILLELKNQHNINTENIEVVETGVFDRIFNLMGEEYPKNVVQAQFHLPYTMACALKFGEVSPRQMNEETLNDTGLKEIMGKIKLTADEKFNKAFPLKLGSGVKIILKNGDAFYKESFEAPWDAGHHPADDELFRKFANMTGEKAKELWGNLFGD